MASSKPKSKVKASSRNKKTVPASKTGKERKAKSITSLPGENDIRIKAQEIYNDRIFSGVHGTPEEDWLKAERLLKR